MFLLVITENCPTIVLETWTLEHILDSSECTRILKLLVYLKNMLQILMREYTTSASMISKIMVHKLYQSTNYLKR